MLVNDTFVNERIMSLIWNYKVNLKWGLLMSEFEFNLKLQS